MSRKRKTIPFLPPESKLIPNIITVFALCAGLTSIRFALQQRWEEAVAAIFIAAILDGLDGRIARLMKATSRFGAELDSLSDFVSFGVAPAILVYQRSLFELKSFGWAIVLIYTICCALRLARFNIQSHSNASPIIYTPGFFTGIPSPAAAVLSLLPMIAFFEIKEPFILNPWVWCIWIISLSGLMISHLPTLSIKNLRLKPQFISTFFLLFVILITLMITFPWIVILVMSFIYILTLPFSYRAHKRKQKSISNS